MSLLLLTTFGFAYLKTLGYTDDNLSAGYCGQRLKFLLFLVEF